MPFTPLMSWMLTYLWWMNGTFGFSAVGRRISAFCVGTKMKQSFDDQKGRCCQLCEYWPIFGLFLLPSVQGIAFIFLSTEEHHMTGSDKRIMSRNNNCHSLAAYEKLMWNHLVSLLLCHKDQRREPLSTWILVLIRVILWIVSDMPCEQRDMALL